MNFYTKKNKDTYTGYCKEYPGISYQDSTKEGALEGIIHLGVIITEDLIVQWAKELNKDTKQGNTLLLSHSSDRMIELDELIKQNDDCYDQLGGE